MLFDLGCIIAVTTLCFPYSSHTVAACTTHSVSTPSHALHRVCYKESAALLLTLIVVSMLLDRWIGLL